jgi:serine/threonine protein kinase
MPEFESLPKLSGSALRPGQTLAGRYRVVRLLGSGGMGAVYEAVHVKLARRFALKVRLPDRDDPDAVRRFEREARIAASLDSRHIVPVVDFDRSDDGTAFLAMDYVAGEDLGRLLAREGALSLRRAVNLLLQACAGVAAAHDRNIVHRDLKPSNLMVSVERDGHEVCQVTDFGVAREENDARGLETAATQTAATQTGALVGTLPYMSPEQIRGEKLDQRSDIYALGAILYECLSERRPFAADAPHTLIYRILHERPIPLAKLRPDLPGAVTAVVDKALAPDRSQRFDHIDDFAHALSATLGVPPSHAEVTVSDTNSQLRLPSSPQRKRTLGYALLVAAGFGSLTTLIVMRRPAAESAAQSAEILASSERSGAVETGAGTTLSHPLPAAREAAPAIDRDQLSSLANDPVSDVRPPARLPATVPPARNTRSGAAPASPRRALAPSSSANKVASTTAAGLNPDAAIDPFAE